MNRKLLIALSRATQKVHHHSAAGFQTGGLTVAQFGVLDTLYHKGSMTVRGLIRSLLSTGGNMTVVISNLEKAGLVTRSSNPEDGRSQLISITQPGMQKVEQIFPRALSDLEESFHILSEEEKRTLLGLLKKVSEEKESETK